jgi:hypothetical protein
LDGCLQGGNDQLLALHLLLALMSFVGPLARPPLVLLLDATVALKHMMWLIDTVQHIVTTVPVGCLICILLSTTCHRYKNMYIE